MRKDLHTYRYECDNRTCTVVRDIQETHHLYADDEIKKLGWRPNGRWWYCGRHEWPPR